MKAFLPFLAVLFCLSSPAGATLPVARAPVDNPMGDPHVIAPRPSHENAVAPQDDCDHARLVAYQTKTATSCTMFAKTGPVDVVFDAHGLVSSATGWDSAGVGHHMETHHSVYPSYYVNTKNYGELSTLDTVTYYDTTTADTDPTTTTKANGQTFYRSGEVQIELKVSYRWVSIQATTWQSHVAYDDYCNIFAKPAENGNFAMISHYDGTGNQHEKFRWTSGTSPQGCNFSFLPKPVPSTFFDEISNRFINWEALSAYYVHNYQEWGVDMTTDPLGIFAAVHSFRVGLGVKASLHPEELTADERHQVANAGVAIVGGLAGLAGVAVSCLVAPIPVADFMVAGAAAYSVGLITTLASEALTDWAAGPPAPAATEGNKSENYDPNDLILVGIADVSEGDNDGDGVGDGTGQDDGSSANDGSGDYEGGDSCGTNPDACGPSDANAITFPTSPTPPPKRAPGSGGSGRVVQ